MPACRASEYEIFALGAEYSLSLDRCRLYLLGDCARTLVACGRFWGTEIVAANVVASKPLNDDRSCQQP